MTQVIPHLAKIDGNVKFSVVLQGRRYDVEIGERSLLKIVDELERDRSDRVAAGERPTRGIVVSVAELVVRR